MAAMKAVVTSFIVFILFASLISLAFVMSHGVSEQKDVVTVNVLSSRVFDKYSSLESALINILGEELQDIYEVNIERINGFNIVEIIVTLPAPASINDFKADMDGFQAFAETEMSEENLVVEVNTSIKDCFPLTINPYDLAFGTVDGGGGCGFGAGQRDFKFTTDGVKYQYLNGYDIDMQIDVDPDPTSGQFTPVAACTGGTLNWTIRVEGPTVTYGPETRMIDPSGKCVFRLNGQGGTGKIVQIDNAPNVNDNPSTMVFTLQPCCSSTVKFRLNHTDIPGGLNVGLPAQALKVRETLFEVERNYTIAFR